MAQGAISDEINRHLEAALSLSKLGFIRQLVSEAELCIDFDQTSAAVILAGIAVEELSSSRDQRVVQALEPKLQDWRELRNRSAHPATREQELDRKAVAAMVAALRTLLNEIGSPDLPVRKSTPPRNTLTTVRGKYVFVPTSVEDFLRRKREDTDLENGT
jgi:hypothetical protein